MALIKQLFSKNLLVDAIAVCEITSHIVLQNVVFTKFSNISSDVNNCNEKNLYKILFHA